MAICHVHHWNYAHDELLINKCVSIISISILYTSMTRIQELFLDLSISGHKGTRSFFDEMGFVRSVALARWLGLMNIEWLI